MGVISPTIPALLTKISNFPHFLLISPPRISMFSLSSRSIGTIVDFDPIDFISSSSSSRALIVLPTKINSAPPKANDLAIDLPSPREAPVTSATLFFILLFISN